MNLVVEIDGRDAIPVRAIPWLTDWEAMTPDTLIDKLALQRDGVPKLQTYSLESNGGIKPITVWQWGSVSPDALPAGVFVWKDEFELMFANAYGLHGASKSNEIAFDGNDLEDLRALGVGLDEMDVNVLEYQAEAIDPQVLDEYRESVNESAHEVVRRVTGPLLESRKDQERRMALCFDVGILDSNIRLQVMKGFEELSTENEIQAALSDAEATSSAELGSNVDFRLLATRAQLIQAFGAFTGMNAKWFANLKDRPKLNAACRLGGKGGKRGAEPMFCPFAVMRWLITTPRRNDSRRPLSAEKGWRIFETGFPAVYSVYEACDPRTDSTG